MSISWSNVGWCQEPCWLLLLEVCLRTTGVSGKGQRSSGPPRQTEEKPFFTIDSSPPILQSPQVLFSYNPYNIKFLRSIFMTFFFLSLNSKFNGNECALNWPEPFWHLSLWRINPFVWLPFLFAPLKPNSEKLSKQGCHLRLLSRALWPASQTPGWHTISRLLLLASPHPCPKGSACAITLTPPLLRQDDCVSLTKVLKWINGETIPQKPWEDGKRTETLGHQTQDLHKSNFSLSPRWPVKLLIFIHFFQATSYSFIPQSCYPC